VPVSAEPDDIRLDQCTCGRLHAPGFLLGVTFKPELSGLGRFVEDIYDAANDLRIIVRIAGPLFRGCLGEQFADLWLRIRQDDQSRIQAGEKVAEPISRRLAAIDGTSKGRALDLAQVVRRKSVEDDTAA
jgi:hypothetical protein